MSSSKFGGEGSGRPGGFAGLDDFEQEAAMAQPFVWKKKRKRDRKQGKDDDSDGAGAAEFREEVEQLKSRRLLREEERKQRERERVEAQRDADRAQFGDWEAREDEFQLRQSRTRAEICTKEGRARPVHMLSVMLQLHQDPKLFDKGLDVDSREPFRIIEGLDRDELEALTKDLETFKFLEQSPENQRFWECLIHVAAHELSRANLASEEGAQMHRILGAHARVSPAIYREIQNMLDGKTRAQLEQLETAIRSKLASDETKDMDYWEAMMDSVKVWQSKSELTEFHRELIRLRRKWISEGGKARRQADDEVRKDADAAAAAKDDRSKPSGAKDSEDREAEVTGLEETEDAAYNAHEIELAPRSYNWSYRYRPRKPKYVNRVTTGYEWNKYNQTHYDTDNPPPKVVQGYKFNIFYPDLLDRSRAPTYRIENMPNGSKDTVLLKFIAGPPYEDIAFEIVNKEWEVSHRRGFRCVFDRGVLQLHFQFRRYFYRK